MNSAVFSDVEGTLLTGNSFDLFLAVGAGQGVFPRYQVLVVNVLVGIGQYLPPKLFRTMQFYILAWLAKGRTVAQMEQISEQTAEVMIKRLKPATLEKLQAHQAAGRKLVLVSAMMHPLVVALARKLNARGEGTHLQIKNGRYLTKLDGVVCQAEGKAARTRAIIEEWKLNPGESYAYGDTANDIPFLKLFGQANVVDPDPKLEAEATRAGWTIIKTDQLLVPV